MFVNGGFWTLICEAFDCHSRKFTSIKSFVNPLVDDSYFKAVCVSNYSFFIHGFFHDNETNIYIYNVDKQMWSNIDSENCKKLFGSNCVKYYTQ